MYKLQKRYILWIRPLWYQTCKASLSLQGYGDSILSERLRQSRFRSSVRQNKRRRNFFHWLQRHTLYILWYSQPYADFSYGSHQNAYTMGKDAEYFLLVWKLSLLSPSAKSHDAGERYHPHAFIHQLQSWPYRYLGPYKQDQQPLMPVHRHHV